MPGTRKIYTSSLSDKCIEQIHELIRYAHNELNLNMNRSSTIECAVAFLYNEMQDSIERSYDYTNLRFYNSERAPDARFTKKEGEH